MKPDIIVKIPLSAYPGISVAVIQYGYDDKNVSIAFMQGDSYVTYGPQAWRMTKDETISLSSALAASTLI